MTTETVSILEPAIADTSNNVQLTEPLITSEPIIKDPILEPVKEEKSQLKAVKESKKSSILNQPIEAAKEAQDYWKEDWREKVAGEDPKLLKELEKHKTPAELAKAYRELQKQFSSTRPLPELPKDPTPEQVAEYRQKVGIPESWEKYDTELNNGVIIGENDKPIVNEYLKKAHEMNMKPDEAKRSLQAYFEVSNQMEAERIRNAEVQQNQVMETLSKEWGVQTKENLAIVATHLEKTLGGDELLKLNQATLPDGTFLVNNPKLLNHFLKQARQEMGGHTIAPNSSNDTPSLAARQKELEKIAAQDSRLFYNSPELRKELAEISVKLNNRK